MIEKLRGHVSHQTTLDANGLSLDVGDEVFVEQAWEDQSGAYHDEYAEVVNIKPFKIVFHNVKKKVRVFLDSCEFEPGQVVRVRIEPVHQMKKGRIKR